MKRRTRIISAVCAAALLGSAMTMPAAAYPMHMNGEAEVPLAQVLQMLENDKTAYVEKGESMYYGLKDPTPAGMYDNIFWFFCKCWGRRKQRSFGKNQMRTAF